jgi:hypothetical protein
LRETSVFIQIKSRANGVKESKIHTNQEPGTRENNRGTIVEHRILSRNESYGEVEFEEGKMRCIMK